MKTRAVLFAFLAGLIVGVAGTSILAWKAGTAIEGQAALQHALLEVQSAADALALLDGDQNEGARSLLIKQLASDAATAESLTADGARVTANIRPLLPLAARLEEQLARDELGMLAVEKLRIVAERQAAGAT